MPEPRPAFPKQAKRRPRKEATRVLGSTRAEERAARRAAHALETAIIRAAVFARAAGLCELCNGDSGKPPTEMHHLLGGSGRRRQQQKVSNCMGICESCHLRWNREGAVPFVWKVRDWAAQYGYDVPISVERVA